MLDELLPGISGLDVFKNSYIWDPASLEFFAKYPNVNLVSHLRPEEIVEFFSTCRRQLSLENSRLIDGPKRPLINPLVPVLHGKRSSFSRSMGVAFWMIKNQKIILIHLMV